MAKDAYYFSHDSNSSTDDKILEMRAEYGWEGYGLFWALIETLRDSTDYKYSLKKISGLALKLNVQKEFLEKFIHDCIDFELFKSDENYFWSGRLIRSMEKFEETLEKRSEAGKKGAEKRWENNKNSTTIANEWQNDSNAIAKNSKGKERKGKEKKGKESSSSEKLGEEKNATTEILDKDFAEIIKTYQENIGLITDIIKQDIIQILNEGIKAELIIEAIKEAVRNNVRKWSYISKILLECYRDNVFTSEQFNARKLENKKGEKHGTSGKSPPAEVQKPRIPDGFFACRSDNSS